MRITEDRLEGYGFNVIRADEPYVDPETGEMAVNDRGEPLTHQVTRLVFIENLPNGWPGARHVVVVPLVDEARQNLIRMLTGGIHIANGNHPVI